MQALCRVLPLRNFFILPQNYSSCKSLLVHRFGALIRKAWNPRQFKGQVWDWSSRSICMPCKQVTKHVFLTDRP